MRGFAKTWRRMGRAGVALVTAVALLAPLGCVKKPQKDAFIEHWNATAQKSEGYTPVSRPRKVEFSKAAIVAKKEEKPEAKPARKLPTMKVTLRMYDTDLVAVVRAMARAANQNVVLSSAIPGAAGGDKPLRININVVDAPWDETFTSILSANGLAYALDGDIVKVMTLADMEQQNKLKEASNKLLAEKTKAKELEPYVMARVEINFAELRTIYGTLSNVCGKAVGTDAKDADKQTPKPGETARDITPSGSIDNSAQNAGASGTRKPGQLNCDVTQDPHSNSIIIQGPPADAERLVALIEELDKPRPQVKLKAFIVQTDRETGRQLGVQWGGLLKNSNLRISPAQAGTATTTTTTGNIAANSATASTSGNAITTATSASNANNGNAASSATASPIFPGGTSGQGFGMNFPGLTDSLTSASGLGAAGAGVNFLFGNIAGNVLEAQLTALAEEKKLKILSSPTITTMENISAFVENGVDVPYVSTSQNGTNVQFAKATLKLEMLPHVVDSSNLRMKILVKDDQVDTKNTVQGNPFIYKRETQSNLVVEDGDTIVISGLTRDTISDNESGVPYLSDIPGLGWAFKTKGSDIKREEIYIFVTPTILKDKPIAPVPAGDARGFPPVAEAALTPKP